MKAINVFVLYAVLLLLCNHQLRAQGTQAKDGIEKLKEAVEAKPDDINVHMAYIRAMNWSSPELIKQYDEWLKKYPQSAIFPYAIGRALSNSENSAAKPYLQRAIALKPDYAAAYDAMAGDAERWGEFDSAFLFTKKAAEIEPENADYAFRFVFADENKVDLNKFKQMCLKLASDFPGTVRGAQALYWLGNRMNDPKEKIALYEQQKKEFPPAKFDWTLYGMDDYFQILLPEQTLKALALAQEMSRLVPANDTYGKRTWNANVSMANNVILINGLLAKGKKTEALVALKKVTTPKRGPLVEFYNVYKAQVLYAAGKTADAYKTMLTAYAKEPSAKMQELLVMYGKKAGKYDNVIEKDWWYIRDTASKQAPDFKLYNYHTQTKTNLSDYKGKVVLLTYWFPGCGPCRGEFPHFENVVRKFKDRKDFVYLGINIVPEQDEYVLPFLKSSGYSFTSLRDEKDWKKGPLDNMGMAPMNFLIDGNGRIMFRDFRTHVHNEESLEMMISGLLNRGELTRQPVVANEFPIRINGTIDLKKPVKKLLARYTLDNKWMLDSANIVNNKFEFRLPVNEPVEFEMYFFASGKNGEQVYQTTKMFVEPGNIGVTIKDTLTNMMVTGSKAQIEYEKIQEQAKNYQTRYAALRAELARDRAANKNEQEIEEKSRLAYKKIGTEERETVYRTYLMNNPDSPIAFDVLQSYIGSWVNVEYATLVEAEKIYNGFTPEVKSTIAGRDIIRRIQAAKNVSVGAMAVDFTLKDSLDKEISLSSFKGQYVLIDFWASWCVPCRANNPKLIKAYNAYKDKGFTVLGVAFDGGERLEKAWRKAMVTDGLPWVNVNDVRYPDYTSVGKQYNVGSIPQNVLVDPSGKIIARNIEGDDLERELEKILVRK